MLGARIAFALLMWIWAGSADAHSAEQMTEADIAAMAASPQWIHLGRWKRNVLSGGGWRSDIVSSSFFLAENGRKDPVSELEATLAALARPLDTADPDSSPLCRFPGRAVYLRQQGLAVPSPLDSCPDLQDFLDAGSTDSVSVLFISGYLSNPGSAFGHLLLRFHASGQDEPVENVLDRAINYGAASSEDDAIVPYIVKGLFGGYRSTFTSLQFFHQAERYRESELRSIWQYKLDLNAEETLLLTAHVYELLQSENRYYFARQNCAWRIAEVLELVVEKDLIPRSKPWVAPIDIFHRLTGDAIDGGEAVLDVKRLASRETLFLEGYESLPRTEQEAVDKTIALPTKPVMTIVEEAGTADPRALYDVLLDYYAFTDETEADVARGNDVIAARFMLPPSEPARELQRIPPHTGQRPSLISVSALYNDELGAGAELRIRPAYFDFLSATVGTVRFSEVVMADTRLLVRDGTVDLRSLEAIRVSNLRPKTSSDPSSGGLSWRVRVGAEDEDLSCDGCLLGYAEYGAGRAYRLARGAALYGLVSGRVELGAQVDSIAHVRPSLGLVVNRRYVALSIEGAIQQGLDDDDESRLLARAELRLGGGQRWDVKLGSAYDNALESSLSLGYYW
ncbi:MAG: DUF4105 domain-containing protein [Pseudomonadota bacterium]